MRKKTLVIGASLKAERYSNIAINKLRQHNIEVRAIGQKEGKVSDVQIDTHQLPYKDIDTVTLYLNAKRQPEYYDYIIGLKPKRVIFNPGTENREFYKLLEDHQISYDVACTLVLLGTNQF
jgi:predicted CoA-binding protein